MSERTGDKKKRKRINRDQSWVPGGIASDSAVPFPILVHRRFNYESDTKPNPVVAIHEYSLEWNPVLRHRVAFESSS